MPASSVDDHGQSQDMNLNEHNKVKSPPDLEHALIIEIDQDDQHHVLLHVHNIPVVSWNAVPSTLSLGRDLEIDGEQKVNQGNCKGCQLE